MTTPAEDKAKLLALIEQLPVHDGKLPINDVKDDGIVTEKGAHGIANIREAEISGIIKAYAVSGHLRKAAADPGTAEEEFAPIRRIVSSLDGGRKPWQMDPALRIDELDLDDKVKAVVTRIVSGDERADTIVPDLRTIQTLLKPADAASSVFDDEVKNAAAKRFYQITEENLYNQSSVRQGYVTGRPTHNGLQQAAEQVSDDALQKRGSITAFIGNLENAPVALAGDENGVIRVFDVGHGDGQTAAAALKELERIRPNARIEYTGIEMLGAGADGVNPIEQTRQAFRDAGLARTEARFITDNLGLKETEEKLTPYLGKQDLVIASHVYNLGDAPTFMDHVAQLQKPEGIAYVAHESPDSWIGRVRAKNRGTLRSGAERVAEINDYLQSKTRDYAKFSVPTTDRLAPLEPEEMAALKTMRQADFTADHAARLPEEKRAQFLQKRDVLESYLRAPLESFSAENRGRLLDAFQEELETDKLTRQSEVQLVLSPERSQELSDAVHKAAEATREQFKSLQPSGPDQYISGKSGGSIRR